MRTLTFQICDESARYIDSLIEVGDYLNANEYLAMLIERDQRAAELPRWMEEELLKGVESLDRGECIEWTPQVAEQTKQEFREGILK